MNAGDQSRAPAIDRLEISESFFLAVPARGTFAADPSGRGGRRGRGSSRSSPTTAYRECREKFLDVFRSALRTIGFGVNSDEIFEAGAAGITVKFEQRHQTLTSFLLNIPGV